MEKFAFFFSLLIFPCVMQAQAWWTEYPYQTHLNFEDTTDHQYLTIDTNANQANIWQIGPPQKSSFSSALSPTNVIVTDTLLPYPTNDTSSFILFHEYVGTSVTDFYLSGWYRAETDSLNDYGSIEVSHDLGNSWTLISDDTTIYENSNGDFVNWPNYIENVTLTGHSNGWQYFFINLLEIEQVFNVSNGDTLLFRFNFISDAIPEIMDGLMFDNLLLTDALLVNLNELTTDGISLHPNPSTGTVVIDYRNNLPITSITIFTADGILIDHYSTMVNELIIDAPGVYIVSFETSEGSFFSKRFIVSY